MHDNHNEGGVAAKAPPRFETRVRALQVDELFRFAATAAGFSFFGALLALGVMIDTGDTGRGSIWFLWATALTFFRFVVVAAYRRRDPASDPEPWGRLVVAGNLLAGIQWGLLGTVLFPAEAGYRQLFTLMVITCFVGGSVTAYAAVKWAHEALALPATVPPAIYLFFVQDGVHLYAGVTALFFCFAIVYYARRLHRRLQERFELEVEHADLVRLTGGLNEQLARENRELERRAAVRGQNLQSARDRAARLEAFFRHSPLAVLECDASAQVVGCNPAAERLVGFAAAEMEGRPLSTIVAPATSKGRAGLAPNLAERAAAMHAVDVMARDGRMLRRIAFVSPLPPAGIGPPGFGMILVAGGDVE